MKSLMVTTFYMQRWQLITKEAMENYCKGGNKYLKYSVNDDLESFLEDIRLGKEPDGEVTTYFLPKLTYEELRMVEGKDTSYLKTFGRSSPDVEEAKMKLSESDSKFVDGFCWRKTFTIENSSKNSPFKISNCCPLQ